MTRHIAPYTLYAPPSGAPVTALVADSPHSGRDYPPAFLRAVKCKKTDLERAEDKMVEVLFGDLPALGIPLLAATAPRTYVDLNRDLSQVFNSNGTGLIRQICTPANPIPLYDKRPDWVEASHRIGDFYVPYHFKLKETLGTTHRQYGYYVHLNLHSMPSMLRKGTYKSTMDFAIGTRNDESASPAYATALQESLQSQGFVAKINVPGFKGLHLINHFSNVAHKKHSLQLEVNRALYMNEATLEIDEERFNNLRQKLKTAIGAFADTVMKGGVEMAGAFPQEKKALPSTPNKP